MIRDEKIDIVKGICLVLMVVCHTDYEHYGFFRRVVHLFHMPVFLIAAGWFFSSMKVGTFNKFCAFVFGRVRRLWIPYVLTVILVVAVSPLLVCLVDREPLNYGREIARAVCMCSRLPERGPLWFLATLFWVYVFYGGLELCLVKLRMKSLIPQTVLAALFLLTGKHIHGRLFLLIGGAQVFVCYALFHLGVLCRRYSVKSRSGGIITNGAIALILMLVLAGMGFFDYVRLAQNQYFSGLTVPIVAVSGWIMCYSLAVVFGNRTMGRLLAYIGKHTMPILLLHMLLFQFVGWLISLCGFHPVHALSHHPACFSGMSYVIVYSIAGIVVPLGLNMLWAKIIAGLRMWYNNQKIQQGKRHDTI